MGEVFAGPGFRTCNRSGCKWPATTSLSFDYGARQTWLEDLQTPPDIASYDLCNIHAGRFSPPHGWMLDDRREMPDAPIDQPVAVPASRPSTLPPPAEPSRDPPSIFWRPITRTSRPVETGVKPPSATTTVTYQTAFPEV